MVANVGRATAVENYREALLSGNLTFTVEDVQRELRGKDLYCWCGPFDECHADTLLLVAAGICPQCGGNGEVRHPRWGSSSCPDPTVICGVCGGTGMVGDGGC